jgi:hypothetical protein
MKESTRKRKKAIVGFKEACGREWIVEQLYRIYESGKQGFDSGNGKGDRLLFRALQQPDFPMVTCGTVESIVSADSCEYHELGKTRISA